MGNILKKKNFTNKTKKEVDDMEKNLQKLLEWGSVDESHEVVSVVFDFIERVRTNIREVERKKPSHSKVFLEKNSKSPSIPPAKSILVQQAFSKNREMISWIDQALSFFSYRISSTILKTESYGDGSFVMQIFRPFLYYVSGEIFEKDLILFGESLSWSQILAQYGKKIDDDSQWRQVWISVLSQQNTPRETVAELFADLLPAMKDFSRTRFAVNKQKSGKPMENIIRDFWHFLNNRS